MTHRLHIRVVAGFCALLCLGTVLGTLTYVALLREQSLDGERQRNASLAQVIGEKVADGMAAAERVLSGRAAGMVPELLLRGERPDVVREEFVQALLGAPLHHVSVFGRTGDLVLTTLPGEHRLNVADQEHFRAHAHGRSGRLLVSPETVNGLTGKRSFYLSRRVEDTAGNFVGVVQAAFATDGLAQLFRNLSLSGPAVVTLRGPDSAVLVRMTDRGTADGADGADGAFYGEAAERNWIEFSQPLAQRAMRITVVSPADAADGRWLWHARIAFLTCIVAVAFIIGFHFWICREMVLRERLQADLRKTGDELRAALERARVAANAKGALIDTVSHELVSPIIGILGNAETIGKAVFGPLSNPEYARIAQDILRDGQRLHGLVSSLLEAARFEAGKATLKEDRVSLAGALREVGRQMAPLCREANLFLDLHNLENDLVVWADPALVRQSLLRALSNAVKFSPDGGAIRVSVRLDGGRPCVEVLDEGRGIPDDVVARIGEPFLRSDAGSGGTGLGLGLALVKSAMELHGGSLEVGPRTGGGTRVALLLPPARLVAIYNPDTRVDAV